MRRVKVCYALLSIPASMLLYVALIAPPSIAQVPQPAPKAVVQSIPTGPILPGTLVTLDASGSTGDDIDWDTVVPETLYRVDSGKRLLYFAPTAPGVYRFQARMFAVVDGKVKLSKASAVITVASPIPTPPSPLPQPVPSPVPTPPPQPIPPFAPATGTGYVGPMEATLLFDLDDPSIVAIRASSIKADLTDLGVEWYAAPKGSATALPFALHTAIDGFPVCYLVDEKGTVRGKLKPPKNRAEIINMVKSVRGIKVGN